MSDEMHMTDALLDLHLGRLDDDAAAALRARIAAEPELARQAEAFGGLVAALDGWKAPAAPDDLQARILQRVSEAPALRVRSARDAGERVNERVIQLHGLRDIIAVAAMIVLAIGIGVPSLLHVRERSQRTLCATNLAQIGQGLQAYASIFGNSLPFAGWSDRNSWGPSNGPDTEVRPNRQHVFPLIRTGHANPNAFVCPSSNDVPMVAATGDQNTFLEARNVSYAYQNMAGYRPRMSQDNPDLVILGDDNPLFDNGRPLFDVAVDALGFRRTAERNSQAHRGAGQNVLMLDGRTKWLTSPLVGGDNIWTLDQVQHYTGHEGPAGATDSHLLK